MARLALFGLAALWIALPGSTRGSPLLVQAPTAPQEAQVTGALRDAASASIGAHEARFHVRRRPGVGLLARSRGLSARFSSSGIMVSVGGATVAFRVVGARAARPVAAGNRVRYRRGALTEWYANGPVGLEQGFTLARPQTVSLRLSGTLVPRQQGKTIFFGSTLRYGGLRAVDADGRSLPSRLDLSGRTLTLRVNDRGARYPVTIDPMIQQGGPITPSDGTGPAGNFGWSVALSSDGNTALIGAPNDHNNVGAAWVYVRSNGVWTQQQLLTWTNVQGTSGALFGYSVALSADGNTALVGGYADNDLQGAAWVATRSNGTWTALTKIATPADANQSPLQGITAKFGSAVALSADGTFAVIGGNGDGGSNTQSPVKNAGAAWVFRFDPLRGWTEDARLVGTGEVGSGGFGSSVAISTPCGQCSQGTILVGAPADNQGTGVNAPGKVWVFNGGNGWFNTTTLFPADMITPAEFGTSVALNGDGTVALVGGPTDDPLDDGSSLGSAWVFTQATGNIFSWSQTGHLVPADVSRNAFFGTGVALSADGNAALVGGDEENSAAGGAWAFTRAGTWSETCKELPSESNLAFALGHSVALSADAGTELIGGPASTTTEGGAAWAFIPGACVSNTRSTVLSDISARVQGTVDANGHAVNSYRIDFGTTTAYGQTVSFGSLAANAAPVDVDQTLTGLQPSTVYHYRVAATSAEGTAGPDRTFTTGPRLTGAPGTRTSGVLVQDTGCPQTATIDWGDGSQPDRITLAAGQPSHCFNPPALAETDFVINEGHTYAAVGHYTITVVTDTPRTYGAGALITLTPSISGTTSQDTTSSGATVSATINPNGTATSYVVQYGTTTSYGQQTAAAAIGSASTGQAVSQVLSGLSANTTYHLRFVATNSGGTTNGPDATFTTLAAPGGGGGGGGGGAAAPPTIVGEAAPVVGPDSATVQASVNPNGSATTVAVQYGTTTSYGQQTPALAIGAGTALQIVSQAISGLTPSTPYHFRFVATSAGGTTVGSDATFITAVPSGSAAQPPPQPVQGESADVSLLQGTVLVNGRPLAVRQQIPFGSIVDATHGIILVETLLNGVLQQMQFSGGIFQLLQLSNGTTQLVLKSGDFSVCKAKPKKGRKKAARATGSASVADDAHTVRMLWGNGEGSFQTKGLYASATVRGTIFQVADRCDGTFTRVRRGTVTVLDLVRNRTFTVTASHSILVKP